MTLLETLIAISLLSIILVFVFSFFRELSQLSRLTEQAQKESFQMRYLESRLGFIFERVVNENKKDRKYCQYWGSNRPQLTDRKAEIATLISGVGISCLCSHIGSLVGQLKIRKLIAGNVLKFLDKLDKNNKLAKTILYNLNPADNELFATMTGNFNDGSIAGKIQWGSAWWFLDQKDGMVKQLNALSNMNLLSRFVGMITDSRSFLSFPRHEYFRRILCDLFGEEIENGELPGDINWTGKVVQDICFYNAQNYFNWNEKLQSSMTKKATV